MVRKISDNGGVYHHPPYTWEEEMELYRQMDIDGTVTILHGPRPASGSKSPPQKPPQSPKDQS